MPLVGLSLGSNLGDRLTNLRDAVSRLAAVRSSEHLLLSSVYETDPVGCGPDDPDFLNAVVEIETDVAPAELLDFLKKVENDMGRPERHEINSPRTVDIDILYYDDEVVETERLKIPHPRMKEREFVMRPLADIRPDLASAFPAESGEVRPTGHLLVAG